MPKLEINIKDENVPLILDSFEKLSNKEVISIMTDRSQKTFKFDPKFENENDLEFSKRIVKEIIVSFVKLIKFDEDRIRYESEIKAVKKASENISNDILE